MADEKDMKAEGENKTPKKKINVVFRRQNSTTIKELPKHLRTAASASEKKARGVVEETQDTSVRRARPLPAGTKPVRRLAGGAAQETESLRREVRTSVPEEIKAVEETENVISAAPVTKEEAGNVAAAAPEAAPEADVSAPAADAASAGAEAPAPEAPRVRIVKSYAGYDAAKVIKEASGGRRRSGTSTTSGYRRSDTSTTSGYRRSDTSTTSGYRRSDGSTGRGGYRSAAPGAPASGRRPGPAGAASTRSARGESSRSGQGTGSRPGQGQGARGRAASSRQRDSRRKDRYTDDLTTVRKPRKGAFIKPQVQAPEPEEEIKLITIPETLSIKDLAAKLRLQPSVIVKKLFLEGQMVTPNTDISFEEAEAIALDYDILCEKEVEEDVIAKLLEDSEDDPARFIPRNPVVCVMGHVDHGKTSLLDAIRNTDVTSHEAGGITQHIGASVVKVGDRSITFLDTPGHEAFTAMRLRGAQSTDIAVLVVAADDGVKPQTVEAINHAKAAEVEVIVAINKMDKEGANPDMVRNELSEYGLISEDWGGETPMVELSARTGEGIQDLLDMILLEADVMELKADPDRLARGLVIEAELDKGRGPVATVLVQKGTLHVGDSVVAGSSYGKVRAMFDDKHAQVKSALPSYPAEILGLSDVPGAGEVFMVVKDEKEARAIAETFVAEHKKHMLDETRKKMNLEDLFEEIQAGNVKELPIIVKADVQGSVEAVRQSLSKLSNEEVSVNVIHAAVGNINESDVSLASAAGAVIIGFNVKPDNQAKTAAEQEKVDVRLYRVIYQAIEDIEAALTGMLAPVYEPQTTGRVIVRQIFTSSGAGTIAGSYVTDGVVERGSKARLYRGDKLIFDGDIASLRRFKDEVREVKLGFECGIVLDGWTDIAVDDTMEIYKLVQVPRS